MNIERFAKKCVTRYTYRTMTCGEVCTQNGQVISLHSEYILAPSWEHRRPFTSIALSVDERVLFAHDGFDLHLLDMATGNRLKTFDMPGTHPIKTNNYFPAMILSVDGQHLFIMDAFKNLYKWNIAQQMVIQTYDLGSLFPSMFIMLGVSWDGRFLFCSQTSSQMVTLNMVTNTMELPDTNILNPGTWEAIQSVLQEQSWEIDFVDLITHVHK